MVLKEEEKEDKKEVCQEFYWHVWTIKMCGNVRHIVDGYEREYCCDQESVEMKSGNKKILYSTMYMCVMHLTMKVVEQRFMFYTFFYDTSSRHYVGIIRPFIGRK